MTLASPQNLTGFIRYGDEVVLKAASTGHYILANANHWQIASGFHGYNIFELTSQHHARGDHVHNGDHIAFATQQMKWLEDNTVSVAKQKARRAREPPADQAFFRTFKVHCAAGCVRGGRNCTIAPWTHWSTCTKKCGAGLSTRTRYYSVAEMANLPLANPLLPGKFYKSTRLGANHAQKLLRP